MNEDLITAGTESATNAAETNDSHGVAAAGGQEGVSTATFEDSASSTSDPKEGDGAKGKRPVQDKQKNAEQARRRREAERARENERVRNQAIIEALNGKNPYTGRVMQDAADVAEFLQMREIENKGGDPVTDYSEHQKAKQREERRASEEKEREAEWFRTDREAFTEKYPDVDLDSLVADEDFADYADGKVGRKPLADIYEGFLRQSARYEERARTRAAQAVANREASPGALGTAGTGDTGYYTREQVQAMSPAEVKKNLPKINESMKRWKP